MRLIDRLDEIDVLINQNLKLISDYTKRANELVESVTKLTEEKNEILTKQVLESDAPTVDAQPVVHGEWLFSDEPTFGNPYGNFKCSICGSESGHIENYCCDCGAKNGRRIK